MALRYTSGQRNAKWIGRVSSYGGKCYADSLYNLTADRDFYFFSFSTYCTFQCSRSSNRISVMPDPDPVPDPDPSLNLRL